MKEKKVYLEFIRAFAIALVIFNHTKTKGFLLFTIATDSPFYVLYMLLSVTCKCAVPLFWMVSGALLLPKEETVSSVFFHRIIRIVIVLFIFSSIHYIWNFLLGNVEEIRFISFLSKLYSSQHAIAYWFLYSYIGMLIILPFYVN